MKAKTMLFCVIASLFLCCCDEHELQNLIGQPIYMSGLTMEYSGRGYGRPLAVIVFGKLDSKYCWWYDKKKFVVAGTMHIGGKEVKQISAFWKVKKAEALASAAMFYHNGQFFYHNYYSLNARTCLIDDAGVAALDLSRFKFYLFAFGFVLIILLFLHAKKSVERTLARVRHRDENYRRLVALFLICSLASVCGLFLLSLFRGMWIFASLIYHWIFNCSVGHGTPGFEAYHLLLVYFFYCIVFTIFGPGYFYNKLKDMIVPALIFGTLAIWTSCGLIMVLCDLNVIAWLTISSAVGLVLAYYYWIIEGF